MTPPTDPSGTSSGTTPDAGRPLALAGPLTTFVAAQLEALAERHLPGLTVPGVFAGHRVGSDVRADLAFTLSWLARAGVDEVAGRAVDAAVADVVRTVDGRRTDTFYSYRVAEAVAWLGGLDDPRFGPGDRDNLAEAVDSTSFVELLDALPANYAAVLARCELARDVLGLPIDEALLDDLLARTRALLGRNPSGYLDDTVDGTGARVDIYTADVYLFCEPFRDRLGEVWDRGARSACDLVLDVAAGNGAAVTWGRSTGVLALAHTVELAALVAGGEPTDAPGPVDRWLGLARRALDELPAWYHEGVCSAHQHRATDGYRGPARRLQLTLDVLGKLAWAAVRLAAAGDPPAPPVDAPVVLPDRDRLVLFDADRHAGVWTHRSAGAALVVPFVGPAWADYLPAPRNPGSFEVPADADLPSFVPVCHLGSSHYVGGGLPVSLTHRAGHLEAGWDGFPESDGPDTRHRRLAGTRATTWSVAGRTLEVTEHLRFTDRVPDAIAVQIPETGHRPLHVEWWASVPHRVDRIDTAGVAEDRSAWGELPVVHQLDLDPAAEVELRWAVTPRLRLASDAKTHHYHRSLYDPIADRVTETSFHRGLLDDPGRGRARLGPVDQFHLHWPEWLLGPDPVLARRFVGLLHECHVRLVWTQHNLVPHADHPEHEELYQVIAAAADAVIHHSAWGRDRALARYRYRNDCRHRVIPHGHFGGLMVEVAHLDRAAAEAELGLAPCPLRIGIVGAPRAAKATSAFMAAFARSNRPDVELLVLSLDQGDEVPDDPRITALPYEFVPRDVYNRRLATLDVIALPFDPDGEMLTTGVVGDVVGLGLPALTSDWTYLDEALGGAAIPYGTMDALPAVIDGLDDDALARARRAARALRDRYDFAAVAEQTLALLDEVGTAKL